MFPSPLFLAPQRALTVSAVATINHLLADESWARASLQRHAGKIAVIDTGHLALRLRVGADGLLEAAAPEAIASVTIHVKLTDLPLIAQNRERAFSYVRIEGDAEFANTISQLSRGLRWEPEHDLERLFGPIGASRLAGGARSVFANVNAGGRRLAENLAEFLVEERPVLTRPTDVDAFGADVVRLRDDVERTAKRIARLEQLAAQKPAQQPAQQPVQQLSVQVAPPSALIPTTRPSGDSTLDS
ncbi:MULTISPECIES: SCP2 sterol-binding domain-containing protein [unclassified Massilia]|uniref:ubiquinone biosynthesis accessory factor UbiJ n=1 Tax=unclassified Massilia TaxID=2609279 RepID=UPI0027D997FD|nr:MULTISPECIES: SCP2 sterol-binding domain-containing protein [unclassified Massilia]